MTDAALDVTVLAKLRADLGGDHAVMRELADAFFSQSPRLLADAHEGAAKLEHARVARAAHTLKSSAGTLGAARLAALARALEQDALRGPVPDVAARVRALADEYEAAERELRAWLDATPTADGHQK